MIVLTLPCAFENFNCTEVVPLILGLHCTIHLMVLPYKCMVGCPEDFCAPPDAGGSTGSKVMEIVDCRNARLHQIYKKRAGCEPSVHRFADGSDVSASSRNPRRAHLLHRAHADQHGPRGRRPVALVNRCRQGIARVQDLDAVLVPEGHQCHGQQLAVAGRAWPSGRG